MESGPSEGERAKASSCGWKEKCTKGGGTKECLTDEAALSAEKGLFTKETGSMGKSKGKDDLRSLTLKATKESG